MDQRLAAPPAPQFDGLDSDLAPDDYVPQPCVVHPAVVEYPHPDDLPGGLAERVRRWDEEGEGRYRAELSGIALGGGSGSLYVFACTMCAERPLAGVLQR